MMQADGAVKASILELPEDQSFENIMGNHAIQMDGFSYLSTYRSMPPFMGPYEKLPKRCVKIGELEHPFLEMLMQYDVEVTSSLYLAYTGYSNVFGLIMKTNMQELEWCMGKMDTTYDLVLMIRVHGKSNELIKESMNEIIICMIGLLVHEMDIVETHFAFIPSKTYMGRKIKMDELNAKFKMLKTIDSINGMMNRF